MLVHIPGGGADDFGFQLRVADELTDPADQGLRREVGFAAYLTPAAPQPD